MKRDEPSYSAELPKTDNLKITSEREAATRLQLLMHESSLRPVKIRDAIANAAEGVVIREIGALCRRVKESSGEGSHQRHIDTLTTLAACAPAMTKTAWSIVQNYAQWLKTRFGPQPLNLASPSGEPYVHMTQGDATFTDAWRQFDEAEKRFSRDGS